MSLLHRDASLLDHHELDSACELQTDDIDDWSARMVELNREYGVKTLGGCCGTAGRHLDALIRRLVRFP